MNFVRFTDTDGRKVDVNPTSVSFVYPSGDKTAIVFAGRSAQPLMVKMGTAEVLGKLLRGINEGGE